LSPATTVAPAASPSKGAADKDAAKSLLVPFTRAAKEHTEKFLDYSTGSAMTAARVPVPPQDIPAYGYARGIILYVTLSGGAGAATVKGDAPFSAIQDISIMDVNGQPIVGPISGYDLYLINKYGGYNLLDPKLSPAYTNTLATNGNCTFKLWLPIEISQRDGLGALGNQNAASTYKLRVSQAATSDVFSVNPATTVPTLRIQGWLSAWTQPTATDLHGNAQATQPPAHGTTSFWSKSSMPLAGVSQAPFRQSRVGNQIRNIILIGRDASDVRTNALFPDPLTLSWDTRVLQEHAQVIWKDQMAQRTGYTGALDAAGGLDTGVYVEDFMHEFDGDLGNELRDGWLSTVQSTRLDFTGTWQAAGTVYALINDVSPAGEVFV
jgi:hypothetical protein